MQHPVMSTNPNANLNHNPANHRCKPFEHVQIAVYLIRENTHSALKKQQNLQKYYNTQTCIVKRGTATSFNGNLK